MDIIESTKKAAKEYLANGKTKVELLECLKKLSSVHETVNYTAKHGLEKRYLKDQMLSRKILKKRSFGLFISINQTASSAKKDYQQEELLARL